MLQITDLVKIYEGGVLALDKVSFEVPKGQFLAVIGLSGSGKSTLLRCINRLIDPTAGKVVWDGIDVTALTEEDLRTVITGQDDPVLIDYECGHVQDIECSEQFRTVRVDHDLHMSILTLLKPLFNRKGTPKCEIRNEE